MLVNKGLIRADTLFLNKYLHLDFQKLETALKAALVKHRFKKPVIAYGDLCLGFNGEMAALMAEFGVVKLDALNCIDCLLGGKGGLVKIDPAHEILFLTHSFLDFFEDLPTAGRDIGQEQFKQLKGIVLLESPVREDNYSARAKAFADHTGLPVLTRRKINISGLKNLINEAFQKNTMMNT